MKPSRWFAVWIAANHLLKHFGQRRIVNVASIPYGSMVTASGNATYVSLGVNNFRLRLGVANVDGTKLVGSADPAWNSGVANWDKLYVYYFTRSCEGVEELTHGFCLSVQDTELAIPPGVKASFVERDYIRVGTQRDPDSKLTLPSMILPLRRSAQ